MFTHRSVLCFEFENSPVFIVKDSVNGVVEVRFRGVHHLISFARFIFSGNEHFSCNKAETRLSLCDFRGGAYLG